MSTPARSIDRTDPGARARARLDRERRHGRRRTATGVGLGALAVVVPVAAEPLTDSPGATVGGVVAAILLVLIAVAVWPWEWSPDECEHRTLASIWREVRLDADEAVTWERYAAWAEPAGGDVELQLIRCAPAARRAGGAPSPFTREVVRRIDADDIARATEAMERLRAEANERELGARERADQQQAEHQLRAHQAMLDSIDSAAAAELATREQQLRCELAEQEAAERHAQAEAVARSIRRP